MSILPLVSTKTSKAIIPTFLYFLHPQSPWLGQFSVQRAFYFIQPVKCIYTCVKFLLSLVVCQILASIHTTNRAWHSWHVIHAFINLNSGVYLLHSCLLPASFQDQSDLYQAVCSVMLIAQPIFIGIMALLQFHFKTAFTAHPNKTWSCHT